MVGYYRATLWPGAERTVRTGYRVAGRAGRDQGDIDGTPGVVTQVKTTTANPEPRAGAWAAQTEAQRAAAGADLGVLVVHRVGHAHPASWWAYLRLDALAGLLGVDTDAQARLVVLGEQLARLELATVVALLQRAGYGTPGVPPVPVPTTPAWAAQPPPWPPGAAEPVEVLPGLVEVAP